LDVGTHRIIVNGCLSTEEAILDDGMESMVNNGNWLDKESDEGNEQILLFGK